ncbi:MAG: endolytic transglycosylase MltG [Bacilli bacterium]
MEKHKTKYKKRNIFLTVLLVINILVICLFIYFTRPVSSSSENVEFVVSSGESLKEIGSNLKKQGLIRNDKIFLGYVILKNSRKIYSAKYTLNKNMTLGEIVSTLKKGGKNKDEITITFKEGLNIRQIAKVISKETDNSYQDVINLSSDETYINELIKKYWFITNDIKNKQIYYPLEGYLFPDSYNFSSKKVSVEEIFNAMIEHMDKKLSKYQKDIEKSNYSVHQILTMASIIELEGIDEKSRKDIAGVFYNRLNAKMSLGSDVTTYYGAKKEMTSDLTQSELDANNGYNTRASGMEGKLPVGPICNSSLSSITSALNPNEHEYYYFVADKNGEVYLTKDYETHNKLIIDLKDKGLWFEW